MDNRLTDLEVKLAFVEHHVAQLDELVREAVGRMEALQAELAALREHLAVGATVGTPDEEVPPHHVRL